MTLNDLGIGKSGKIIKNRTTGVLKQRFMDMGITKGIVEKVLNLMLLLEVQHLLGTGLVLQ